MQSPHGVSGQGPSEGARGPRGVTVLLASGAFSQPLDGVFNFAGNVADLGMWSRALSAPEVATLRSVGLRGLPADPARRVAIRGNEGTGTIANDASGNGNRAMCAGAARWSMSCPARP